MVNICPHSGGNMSDEKITDAQAKAAMERLKLDDQMVAGYSLVDRLVGNPAKYVREEARFSNLGTLQTVLIPIAEIAEKNKDESSQKDVALLRQYAEQELKPFYDPKRPYDSYLGH
jgi:hypothetical protein